MIAQPALQYVQPMPMQQQQPQVVYQQIPVQPGVMPQPVIPNIPGTGRRPVIPAVQTQYQTQPAYSMPEPVVPSGGVMMGDQQPIGMAQPGGMSMPEPMPARPPTAAPMPSYEPVMQYFEPQIPPGVAGPRLAPGQYSAFDRPLTPPRNPPPAPPKDLYEMSPYRHLLEDLKRPIDEDTIRRHHTIAVSQSIPLYTNMAPPQNLQPHLQYAPERKHKKGGLLRSLSARLNRRRQHSDSDDSDDPSRMHAMYGGAPMQPIPEGSAVMYASVLPNLNSGSVGGRVGATPSPTPMPPSRPATPQPPPIVIERNGQFGDLLHSSHHRVMWDHRKYPTAAHLFEAFKFLEHRPELAERVRRTGNADEAAATAASMGEHVRPDWQEIQVQLVSTVIRCPPSRGQS